MRYDNHPDDCDDCETCEPHDVEVEREQIRELNGRNRQQQNRLKWGIALGLVVLLAWGWFFRYVYRLIYQ